MSACIKSNMETKTTLHLLTADPKQRHDRAIRLALYDIGDDVSRLIAKYIISPPKTGRIYIINGKPHQASAPFESPAELTGKLRESINWKVRGSRQLTIGESAYYAKWLEKGTYDGRIQPRPHVLKAILANHMNARRTLMEYIEKAACGKR